MSRYKKPSSPHTTAALICGIIYAAIGLIIRMRAGNPFEMLHIFGADALFPPMWIFNLLCLVWMFLSGCAAGRMISLVWKCRVGGRNESYAYGGGLFFIALFFLTLLWYPLFFSMGFLWLCLAVALTSLIFSVICAMLWRRADPLCFVIMAANSIWHFYILLANLSIVLRV